MGTVKRSSLCFKLFDPTTSSEVSRRDRDGSKKRLVCPLAVFQYKKYIRWVDLSDQKLKYYAINRKSKRNRIRIPLYFLNVSLNNSFLYYKNLTGSDIKVVDYISPVSIALIGDYCSRKIHRKSLRMSNQKKTRFEKVISKKELWNGALFCTYARSHFDLS